MQQVSDWAVKRLLKALLKRHLKHILATELDTEQLHFSLGKGRFELKDVLVSPEWLAGHAVSRATHTGVAVLPPPAPPGASAVALASPHTRTRPRDACSRLGWTS